MNPPTDAQRHTRKNINGQRGRSAGEMWGLSLALLDSVVFWATIIAAVAGGLSVGAAFISTFVGGKVTARLQREADERIAEADERAAKAELLAAEAHKTARQLEHDNLTLQGSIAALEKESAIANEKAEQERLARVKIEEKLAPRSLSEEQQQKLIAKWKPFAGQKVEVFVAYEEEELLNTGRLIEGMLRSAGWSVKSEQALGITIGPERKGIVLYVSKKVSSPARTTAQTWVESLAEERFVVSGPEAISDLSPEAFRVAIGRK